MPVSATTQAAIEKAVADNAAADAADVVHNNDLAAIAAATAAEAESHAADLAAHQTAVASFQGAVNALATELGEQPPFPGSTPGTDVPPAPVPTTV